MASTCVAQYRSVLETYMYIYVHICIYIHTKPWSRIRQAFGQDSFIWDIPTSYETCLIHMKHDSFMSDMTHPCETWLIHMRHDVFIEIWLTHVKDRDRPLTLYAHLQSGKKAKIFKSIRSIACMLSFCKWERKKRNEEKKYDSQKKTTIQTHSLRCLHAQFLIVRRGKKNCENKCSRGKAKKFQENLLAGSVSDSEEKDRGNQDRHDQDLRKILIVLISFSLFWYILMIFTWNTHLYIHTYNNWNVNTYIKYSSMYIYMKNSSIYIYNWNVNTYMRSSSTNIYFYWY